MTSEPRRGSTFWFTVAFRSRRAARRSERPPVPAGSDADTYADTSHDSPIAATTEPGAEPLDEAMVDELRQLEAQGSEALVATLMGSYLVSADSAMSELASAVTAPDFEAVVAIAHRLAGSSGTVGAAVAAKAFSDLERAGALRDIEASQHAMVQVEAALVVTRPALEAERMRSLNAGTKTAP